MHKKTTNKKATTVTRTGAKTEGAAGGAALMLTVTPAMFIASCHADMEKAKLAMAHFKSLQSVSAASAGDVSLALETFDTALVVLGNVISRCGLAHEVHPAEAMRGAAEKCEQEAIALYTQFSLDREVYETLRSLDVSQADAATRYFVEKTLRDFRLAGVDRDPATRARIQVLNQELTKIGQEFAKNVREDTLTLEVEARDLEGLPEDFRRSHAPGINGKVVISTDNNDYIPVVTYARNEKVREAIWRLYLHRGHPKNLTTLSEMLEKRFELAQLLGFRHWADYITQDKMTGNEKTAAGFIARITDVSGERSRQDYHEFLGRKRHDDPAATQVNAWDSNYLQDRLKAEQYGFDSQAVRPYFEFTRVQQGVFDLTGRLFGIRYQRVEDFPAWDPEVETYDIYSGEKLLGRIYLDMFPRENKYKHYAQFTLVAGREGNSQGDALPEGVLVCNFPRPGKLPGLMEYRDVRTYFHEFGHLLHHIFGGHIRWGSVSGTAVQQDFVEVPSQILEEWVRDPATLQLFARHYQTDEPIPTELVNKMRAADEVARGLNVRQQMFYAATSLSLYNRDPQGLDTTGLIARLQEEYTPYKYVDDTYFHESFGHLDGYSAVYYTYMWSLVISKDMFTVFQSEGLLNPKIAARYRKAVLEPGGSKPAAEMVQNFLGRPYSFKAYEDWLNQK